jgi:hypothetical protein
VPPSRPRTKCAADPTAPGYLRSPKQPPSGVQREAPEISRIAGCYPRRYTAQAGRLHRKQKFKFSKKRYRERHRIENALCRLKDFRRVATRYDKLAVKFAASVYLAPAIV